MTRHADRTIVSISIFQRMSTLSLWMHDSAPPLGIITSSSASRSDQDELEREFTEREDEDQISEEELEHGWRSMSANVRCCIGVALDFDFNSEMFMQLFKL